jgi:hypothetical protein
MMNAEITTKKVGSKWHGYIEGRPDLDETALTEEAARRKMEQLRERIGECGAKTKLFSGRTCELMAGHHEPGVKRVVHRSGSITWFDVPADDPKGREKIAPLERATTCEVPPPFRPGREPRRSARRTRGRWCGGGAPPALRPRRGGNVQQRCSCGATTHAANKGWAAEGAATKSVRA